MACEKVASAIRLQPYIFISFHCSVHIALCFLQEEEDTEHSHDPSTPQLPSHHPSLNPALHCVPMTSHPYPLHPYSETLDRHDPRLLSSNSHNHSSSNSHLRYSPNSYLRYSPNSPNSHLSYSPNSHYLPSAASPYLPSRNTWYKNQCQTSREYHPRVASNASSSSRLSPIPDNDFEGAVKQVGVGRRLISHNSLSSTSIELYTHNIWLSLSHSQLKYKPMTLVNPQFGYN